MGRRIATVGRAARRSLTRVAVILAAMHTNKIMGAPVKALPAPGCP
jgi:hypothetical protein